MSGATSGGGRHPGHDVASTEPSPSTHPPLAIERRRSRRWVVTIGLVADLAEKLSSRGLLVDLSMSGAYIVLDTSGEVRTNATLTFGLDEARARVRATGHVARFEAFGHRCGIGLAFTDVDDGFRSFVRELDTQGDAGRIASFQRIRSVRLLLR